MQSNVAIKFDLCSAYNDILFQSCKHIQDKMLGTTLWQMKDFVRCFKDEICKLNGWKVVFELNLLLYLYLNFLKRTSTRNFYANY